MSSEGRRIHSELKRTPASRGRRLRRAPVAPRRAARGEKGGRMRAPIVAAAPQATKIYLSDDHPVVRRGLRALVESDPSFCIVGESSNGRETIAQVKELKPDILVLDISMPELNGLDVTRILRREAPEVSVIILTMHFAEEVARECLRAGARAYVLKSDADTDLVAALRAVRAHKPFFTPQVADIFYNGYLDCNPNAPLGPDGEIPVSRLTPREIEIVKMLCEGMSNKEVAVKVGISTRTVESHRNNVMRKLRLGAFSGLVRYSVRHGLVNP